MNERQTQWTYDLNQSGQDKSRPRVFTPPNKSFEVVGADGNMDGGFRPISGFKEVAKLDYRVSSGASSTYQFTQASHVIDFFPVNFKIQGASSEGYGYGYVYRVTETGKTTSVFIEYYDSLLDKWVSFGGNGIAGLTASDKRIQYADDPTDETFRNTGAKASGLVTFTGLPTDGQTIVIVNAAGGSTTLTAEDSLSAGAHSGSTFSVNTGGSTANVATALAGCINGLTGGSDPGITATVTNSTSVTLQQDTFALSGNTTITNNLSNSSKTDFSGGKDKSTCLITDRFTDANAQMSVSVWGKYIYVFCEGQNPVVAYVNESGYLETLGSVSTSSFPGAGRQPQLVKNFCDTNLTDSGGGTFVATDIGTRDSSETVGDIAHTVLATDVSGSKKFPAVARIVGVTSTVDVEAIDYGDEDSYQNVALDSDGNVAPAVEANDKAHAFEPGDYAFAYFLYNSKTGRKTQLSQICEAKKDGSPSDFNSTTTKLKICLDIRYNSDLYDQAFVYRSVKTQSAGGSYIAGILHLDNIINLEEWHVKNDQSTGVGLDIASATGARTAVYWYQLSDASLVYQDIHMDKAIHDERMPKGGSSIFYEGSMVVSNIDGSEAGALGIAGSRGSINRVGDADRGLGETRWSSIFEVSPELFPPTNRYLPPTPTNSIESFFKVGPTLMGLSRDRVYYLLKDGLFFRMQEAHQGYGIVNPKAGDSIGPLAYYITTRGVKAIHPNSRIDDVDGLNKLIVEDWRDNHDVLQVAYDPTQLALYIHNPTLEQTAVMWFNTGKITEIHDTSFDHCSRGVWSSDLTDPTKKLEERAIWLMNNPDLTHGSISSDYRPGVYILDNQRKTITDSGKGMVRQIQHSATTPYGSISSASSSDNYIQFSSAGIVTADQLGCYVYITNQVILGADQASSVGGKFKVTAVDTGNKRLYMSASDYASAGPLSGQSVSISPVLFRVVGAPITSNPPTPDRPTGGNNLFRVKQVSSLGAVFSNVSFNHTSTAPLFWRGLVFEGEDTDVKSYAMPLDRNDSTIISIKNGESDNWAAFSNPTTTTVKGRHGVQGFSLSPGLEIFCVDVDYRLLQMQVKGVIRATNRTEIGS